MPSTEGGNLTVADDEARASHSPATFCSACVLSISPLSWGCPIFCLLILFRISLKMLLLFSHYSQLAIPHQNSGK